MLGFTRSRAIGGAALALAAVALAAAARPAHATAACPWMNTKLAPDQRARLLLGAMTLEQKVSMVHGGGTSVGTGAGAISAIPSLCVPALGLADGAGGLGNGNTGVTAFPAPIAQAAAFDPAQQQGFGTALGQEFVQKGENDWLAPNVNIARYPLNGRNFEAYGEDPYLAGATAVAAIRGVQAQHVIATVKHYLANNSETNRMYSSSDVDDRTLHEIYLPAFEAAVQEGRSGSVMCSYNRVNEVYACSNATTLRGILEAQLGFDGFVVSDWLATHALTDANAGLDMEMPNGLAFAPMSAAVTAGIVPQARLDNMVYRTLFTMFRLGLFDHPVPAPAANVSTGAHQDLARTMAENGSVLLKNAGGLLPLVQKRQTIAVVGPVGPGGAANVCSGGGSATVTCSPVDALGGIQGRAQRNGDTVLFADGSDPATAAATAARADVAVVFGYYTESEGSNRTSLSLDGNGDALVGAVAAANPHTVVVLQTGGPVLMPWLGSVGAVLEAWYPGVQLGNAIAAVLFGDADPGGRLPETFPASTADLPTAGSPLQQNDLSPELNYSEGLDVGYRWYDAKSIAPLFPFGFGLSYTTFAYSGLKVARTTAGASVTFTVANTGARSGSTVAQVYVGFPAAAGEAPHRLVAYRKLALARGARTTVTIALDARAFSVWSTASQSWAAAPGCFSFAVGSSSRDLPLTASAGVFQNGC